MPSNHLILCLPLRLLPSIFPSIRVFSSESALCIRWPKYWSFSISLSKEYSGLISFRIDSCDLLAVQGTVISHTVEHLPSQPCQNHCKSPSSLAASASHPPQTELFFHSPLHPPSLHHSADPFQLWSGLSATFQPAVLPGQYLWKDRRKNMFECNEQDKET